MRALAARAGAWPGRGGVPDPRGSRSVRAAWAGATPAGFCSVSAVGRPIPVQRTPHPTQQQVEELHQTYMEELRKLFEEHKGKYGIAEHESLVLK